MSAKSWIETNPEGIRDDIRRLGVGGAAEYQMDLLSGCVVDGDMRWSDVTLEDMQQAIGEFASSEPDEESA